MAQALSERTTLGEAPPRPVLKQMIAERDRLTAGTGRSCGSSELSLRDSDPIRHERFYARTLA